MWRMSGSKGSKRISVFDRLGPGNDEVRNALPFTVPSMQFFSVELYASPLQFRQACRVFVNARKGEESHVWFLCSFSR